MLRLQRNNSVSLHLTTSDGDYALETDWVVAADGGRSTIREALGLQLQGVRGEFDTLAQTMRERGVPFRVVPVSTRLHLQTKGVHAWDHTGRIFERYDANRGTVYLVRPDGHVLGRWRDANAADVEAAITRALA